jgi:hypothetical protein
VDKKIKPIVIPLPKDSWQRMKEVAKDPSLRDPKKIGYIFTKDPSKLAHTGGCASLVGVDVVLGKSHSLQVDVMSYFAKGRARSKKKNVPHIEKTEKLNIL